VIGGRVLDPTAIIDIGSGRSEYGQALVDMAIDLGVVLALPAAALMEAWAGIAPAAWGRLNGFVQLSVVVVVDLDGVAARITGVMASRAGQPACGLAHAVHVAQTRGWPVVTRDREALLALDPRVPFESLP
jgi:hypothetical protein